MCAVTNYLAEMPRTLREVWGVLRVLRRVETTRRTMGPGIALANLRQANNTSERRDPLGRKCLQRAIRWVDFALFLGGNCYRRALLEMTLDRGAADEPLIMGLSLKGDRLDGHTWLESHSTSDKHYSVIVRL